MKKLFMYSATEENGYEICKETYTNADSAYHELRECLTDNGQNGGNMSEKEADETIARTQKELSEKGFAYVECEGSEDTYRTFFCIAYHGYTKPITDMLKEERREFIAMCG